MYEDKYDDKYRGHGSRLCFAVKVYAIANKYQIPELQRLATVMLESLYLDFTEIPEFIIMFSVVPKYTYLEDDTLLELFARAIVRNVKALWKSEEFRKVVEQNHMLQTKVLDSLALCQTTWGAENVPIVAPMSVLPSGERVVNLRFGRNGSTIRYSSTGEVASAKHW